MFEQFPYANFHEMNMDWVIKVVKDFLDKYEYIEELINTGKTDIVNLTNEELQALTDKKNELEALLQAWYDSHSADIAQQLAEAISAFNTAADNKAAQTIASIPDDYTTLSNNVDNLKRALPDISGNVIYSEFLSGWYSEENDVITNPDSPTGIIDTRKCIKISCSSGDVFNITGHGGTSSHRLYAFTDTNYNVLSVRASSQLIADNLKITAPANTAYLFCNFTDIYSYPNLLIGNTLPAEQIKELQNYVANNPSPYNYLGVCNDGNLDEIFGRGWYSWTSSHVPTNVPDDFPTVGGFLFSQIATAGAAGFQVIVTLEDEPNIYTRRKSSGGFQTWIRLPNRSEFDELSNHTDRNSEYSTIHDRVIDNSAGSDYITSYFDLSTGRHSKCNTIVHIRSSWTGSDQPQVRWVMYDDSRRTNVVAESTYIPLGDKIPNSTHVQTLRLPPWRDSQIANNASVRVRILIPAGTVLTIKDMYNEFEERAALADDCGIVLCAHSRCGGNYPSCTMAAFSGAAQLGYKYCIAIPKVTSDGVYVCLHDDADIGATARNDDGSRIDPEYDLPVNQLTYAQLKQFDFGIYKGIDFAGERIPLLEDFFKLCAVTGMHPMLSVHPSLDGHWANIKAMAKQCGVLNKLIIKAGASHMSYPMAVMLNDVEGYVYEYSSATYSSAISAFNTLLNTNNIDRSKLHLIVENMGDTNFEQSHVDAIIAAGFEAGRAAFDRNTTELTDDINMGVTWFTDDYTPFSGLNWL